LCLTVLLFCTVFSDLFCPASFSIRMVLTARVLRLFRLLTALKQFQLIGKVSAEILPAARGIFGLLFLLLYFYAVLGMQLYGGLISRNPDDKFAHLILGSDFAESNYWANNFNDMLSGMNVSCYTKNLHIIFALPWLLTTTFRYYIRPLLQVLFNLLVVNNWMVCEVGFEAATEQKWVRFFFLSFHILGVIMVNNLVIAFVITNFLTQFAIFKENLAPEVIEGEAIIQDRRALFDAAQITGTSTSLTGAYIARLRHSNSEMDGGDHHHKRLRELFTQQSSNVSASSERAVD